MNHFFVELKGTAENMQRVAKLLVENSENGTIGDGGSTARISLSEADTNSLLLLVPQIAEDYRVGMIFKPISNSSQALALV